ncbi:hypothetical protein HNR53_003288 [Bacillus benzoevorans]|uniref:Uncharacterized protein n=1 Tax=Bacillus benzoevorans TaxID=1456 RepID=A0A7X0HTP1_9BACI|nr:hypothetical protein [Bacillus benzoevorans]
MKPIMEKEDDFLLNVDNRLPFFRNLKQKDHLTI